ncbi:unnamed protein product, partial [Rotaria magnacalcarata]
MNVNIISPSAYTWVVILLATICSFGVLFCSSGYIGNVQGNIIQVGVSTMVALLGVSLFYALLPEASLQAGGTLADIFMANQCAIIITLLVEAIFMGLVLRSIVAGFVGDNSGGWRWFQEIMTILTAIVYRVLYMLLAAFPIVYKQKRESSTGATGLAVFNLAA